MMRAAVLVLLIVPVFVVSGSPVAPQVTSASAVTGGDEACGPGVVGERHPKYWGISYEFFRSVAERTGPEVEGAIWQSLTGPGELRVFVRASAEDKEAQLEFADYYRQRSAESLYVDYYGIPSVSWADVQRYGTPDLLPEPSRFGSVVEFGHKVAQNLGFEDWPEPRYPVVFACSTIGER